MSRRTRSDATATCACPRAKHDHGTVSMHKYHRCGCHDCRMAKREYDREYTYRTGRATKPVPTDKVLNHIESLMGAGMPLTVIADTAGVHPDTLTKIRGGRKRIYQDVEQFILAVEPPAARMASRSPWVPIVATQRRLRGLAVMGWSTEAIAERSGLSRSQVKDLRLGRSMDVTKATELTVERITSDLVKQPQPMNRSAALTRASAARNGWVSMFAYDDISDPNENPNVTPIETARSRDERSEDRIDELRHLINGGEAPESAAVRAGYPTLKAAVMSVKNKGEDFLALQLTGGAA